MSSVLTEAEKELVLGTYRRAVEFYQPKIEARTGVSLGEINVWDYDKLHEDLLHNWEQQFGFVRRLLFRRHIRKLRQAWEKSSRVEAEQGTACFHNGSIYVSFCGDGLCLEPHHVAFAVVHELAHALWEKLEGGVAVEVGRHAAPNDSKESLFVEGYATYAELIWFSNLYPDHVRSYLRYVLESYDEEGMHRLGMRKIQDLVEQSGNAILLEIPCRWKEL